MNTPKVLSKLFLLVAWVACDTLLFRFSREGYTQYTSVLFGIPLALGAITLLAWNNLNAMVLSRLEVFCIGLWSKLISFHWYVIPIVYRFQQREEWPLEIGHQVLGLLVQVSVVLFILRLGKSFGWYQMATGKSGASATPTAQRL